MLEDLEMSVYKNIIAGEFVDGDQGSQPVFNPATGEEIASVMLSGAGVVDKAVAAAAKAALPGWANTPPLKRARIMFNYKALLEENLDALAEAISTQHGKTKEDARGEVIRGSKWSSLPAVSRICCVVITPAMSALRWTVSRPPATWCGCRHHPFNFPAMVPMWMFPMAIACGNTFILKPSERDPAAPQLALSCCRKLVCPTV